MDAGEAANSALLSEASAVTEAAAAARAKLLAEQQFLALKIKGMKEQLAQARSQIRYQQEQVEIAETDLKRFQIMAADHNVAERLVGDRRSAVLSAQQSLAGKYSDAAAVQQQIADALNRQEAIKSELKANDASAQSTGAQVTQKIIQNSAQSSDLVVASVGGRVQAIPVEQGQNLAAGATLAVITPKGARLEAELYAPSKAIGFVRPGQQVHLMYQAFPHEKFGVQLGRIVSLSHTILSPSELQIPGINVNQPVFRIRVVLANQSIHAYGENVPLQPGMLLSANIVFDHRTLLQWLFDPIYAAQK
ncbi:membrane fusion protein [Rhizomicrobium palustre]|uniref:Membrane fusion protein n=1 Tax=Rhizomicrobium palustre TaxID=189966 RepID=A0A846N3E4_9PROT|nr:HlyD family efflux transporter periplasmic adaptor subunit [Rhizomicrobium palustre]NIK90256.1 membrane fusion protein [Rhizomicrobium palustre]